jgi:beclin 1
MIVASLSPSPPDGDNKFPTSAVPKPTSQRGVTSPSPHTTVKQPRRPVALPNESFVLLQDSVVHRIPAVSQPPPKSKRVPSSGSAKVKSPGTVEDAPSASGAGGTKEGDNSEVDTEPKQLAFSHHLRSTLRLFDILSTRTDIDHPLCDECTQILLTGLKRTLDETKKERDGYIAFEKEVRKEREREGTGISKEDAEKKIERLKEEERVAVEQLKEAEQERAQIDAELEALEAEEKALEAEEAE